MTSSTNPSKRLDYRWNLRQVMADRGMFQTTDLIEPLADRGIRLSSSQVYRLVVDRPERLSLAVLMALLDILNCTMDDLIEPITVSTPAHKKHRAASASATGSGSGGAGAGAGVGEARPKRARIVRAQE